LVRQYVALCCFQGLPAHCMLSCSFALRKSCSGPVGGHRANFKVGQTQGPCSFSKKAARCAGGLVSQPLSACEEIAGSKLDMGTERTEVRPASSTVNVDQRHGSARAGRRHAHSSDASFGSEYVVLSNSPGMRNTSSSLETSFSQPSLTQSKPVDTLMSKLKNERIDVHRDLCELRDRGTMRQSRRLCSSHSMTSGVSYSSQRSRLLSSAGSFASGMSSCPSQAVRSSMLSLELEMERDRRIAAEADLACLKNKFSAAPFASC